MLFFRKKSKTQNIDLTKDVPSPSDSKLDLGADLVTGINLSDNVGSAKGIKLKKSEKINADAVSEYNPQKEHGSSIDMGRLDTIDLLKSEMPLMESSESILSNEPKSVKEIDAIKPAATINKVEDADAILRESENFDEEEAMKELNKVAGKKKSSSRISPTKKSSAKKPSARKSSVKKSSAKKEPTKKKVLAKIFPIPKKAAALMRANPDILPDITKNTMPIKEELTVDDVSVLDKELAKLEKEIEQTELNISKIDAQLGKISRK